MFSGTIAQTASYSRRAAKASSSPLLLAADFHPQYEMTLRRLFSSRGEVLRFPAVAGDISSRKPWVVLYLAGNAISLYDGAGSGFVRRAGGDV